MKTIKILLLTLIVSMASAASAEKPPKWDLDGSRWLGSANLGLYYPLATLEYGLGSAFMPGLELSMRNILNHKRELEFSTYYTRCKFPLPRERYSSTSFTTDGRMKCGYTGFGLATRNYGFLGLSFPPVGFYTRLGLRYELLSANIPEGRLESNNATQAVPSAKYKEQGVTFMFGLGKEFPIGDKLFMGFNTNFAYQAIISGSEYEDYHEDAVATFNTVNLDRNAIIVNYNVSYLF